MLKKLGLVSLLGVGLLSGCATTPQKYGIDPDVIFVSSKYQAKDPLRGKGKEFYEEKLRINPKDWKAHLHLAEGFMENARPREAIPHYEILWEMSDKDKIPQLAYFHLPEAYNAIGQERSAILIAQFAADKWPDDPMIWRHLAQRYEDYEKWGLAIMAWHKKQSLKDTPVNKFRKENNSEEEKFMENMSISRCYVRLGKYKEALELNNQLVNKYPQKSLGYILRGSVYEEMEKYGDAMADFNTAYILDQKKNIGDKSNIERVRKKIYNQIK